MDEAMVHQKPVRDDPYYLEFAIFLVEDNLFKVPKRYLEANSGIFSDILALPSEGDDADGSSDEKAIRLAAVKKVDFERLLGVMYPVCRPVIMGRNEWESALKLSTLWGIGDIRDMAIQKLVKDLDCVSKILLGQACGVPNWLLDGCKELAEREETISGSEGRRLGPDTAAKLWQIREAGIKASVQPAARYKGYFKIAAEKYNYENRIQQVFSQELADAETADNTLIRTARLQSQPISDDPATSTNSQPVRSERFYMGGIIFLVEDQLFKIPQACFEHSGIFSTIFSLPPVNNTPIDGSDDEHPFKLEGINKSDFRAFLKVMYPRDIPLQTAAITEEEWTVVLRLSSMWEFFDVRKLAIEELSKVVANPVTKILLARQYTVQKWLFAGYNELASRTEPISIDEAEQLGWDTAILIFQIREESLAKFQTIRTSVVVHWEGEQLLEAQYDVEGPFDRTHCDCAEGIRRAFAKELKDAEEIADEAVARPEIRRN